MELSQAFRLAIKSLLSSKLRSFLTMLGIIIGVASVITLVSLMSGVSDEMMTSFESIGTNKLTVSIKGRGSSRNVKPSGMQSVADDNPDLIGYMTPNVTLSATVKNGTENITSSVTGANEYYDEINSKDMLYGNCLTYLDVEQRLKKCVIGTYVSEKLFGTKASIGQTLKINGNAFTVCGVFEETADSEEGSADDVIVIPYTIAQKLSFTGISSYTYTAKDNDTVDAAKRAIEDYLYSVFEDTDAYFVFSMAEAVDMIDSLMGTIESVLVGIAAISLLVGGIGIMNIMLVSVTERTREIGIRKALGASPWDILSQFVVEAITTSAVGGVIGIFVGVSFAKLIAKMINISSVISVGAVLVAFGVSAGIGITFGYFPAKKAAALNPIDALRYE